MDKRFALLAVLAFLLLPSSALAKTYKDAPPDVIQYRVSPGMTVWCQGGKAPVHFVCQYGGADGARWETVMFPSSIRFKDYVLGSSAIMYLKLGAIDVQNYLFPAGTASLNPNGTVACS